MKKILVLLFAVVALSVTAYGAEVDVIGNIEIVAYGQYWNGSSYDRLTDTYIPIQNYERNFEMPRQGEFTDPVGRWDSRSITPTGWTFGLSSFEVNKPEGSNGFYGNCALYLNWYVRLYRVVAGQYRTFDTPLYFTIYDASGKIVDSGEVKCSFYDVAEVAGQQVTKGVACAIKFNVPEAIPAIRVELSGDGLGKVGWFPNDKTWEYKHDAPIELYVPSATLLASVKSAEVEALEDVTNAIIEQNGLTQEKFTEVIGKVDEVYKEIGTTNNLLEESMKQFDDWNTVTDVPSSVTDKTDKGAQLIEDMNQLEKPQPDTLLPSIDTDTDNFGDVFGSVFQNTIIVQMCTMMLGFALVSYVLFGKKG